METEKYIDDEIEGEELIRLDMMYDEVRALLMPDFVHDYVACYLQALHKYEFLKRKTTPIKNHIYSCLQDFNCVEYEDIELNKIKTILKEKYRLKIVQEEPYLELEEI